MQKTTKTKLYFYVLHRTNGVPSEIMNEFRGFMAPVSVTLRTDVHYVVIFIISLSRSQNRGNIFLGI